MKQNDKIFNVLNSKFQKIRDMGWIKGNQKNTGSAGIMFEELLGNTFNNFELPDYEGVEIKTKSSKKEKYISLFNAVPDSFLYEIKRIIEMYGYPDKDFPQFNIFNMDIYTFKFNKGKSNFYFKLRVDDIEKKVILEVYDRKFNLIDNDTKWSFGLLKEKLERKLDKLAFVKVDKKFSHNELFYKYSEINFYKLKCFEAFIELLRKGIIKISLRIGIYKKEPRIGNIYDHGSSFNIKVKSFEKLFQKVILIDE